MAKCILKCDDFVDKEIEIDGHRNFIEAVRSTHELKENASSVSFDGDGYVIVWYDFSEYVDGVGIYLSGEVNE